MPSQMSEPYQNPPQGGEQYPLQEQYPPQAPQSPYQQPASVQPTYSYQQTPQLDQNGQYQQAQVPPQNPYQHPAPLQPTNSYQQSPQLDQSGQYQPAQVPPQSPYQHPTPVQPTYSYQQSPPMDPNAQFQHPQYPQQPTPVPSYPPQQPPTPVPSYPSSPQPPQQPQPKMPPMAHANSSPQVLQHNPGYVAPQAPVAAPPLVHSTTAPARTAQPNHNRRASQVLGADAADVDCPHCHVRGVTKTEFVNGQFTHISGACCTMCLCCCVPYMAECFKDVKHSCQSCNREITTWKRSNDKQTMGWVTMCVKCFIAAN